MTNEPPNGVLLCTACHRWIESHREQALSEGWLVRQGQDPGAIPILYHGAYRALLTEQGTILYEQQRD